MAYFDAIVTFKEGEPSVKYILCFRDYNEFLSNFYEVPIEFEERFFRGTEPAYFAWMSSDGAIKDKLQGMSGSEAKAFARTDEFKIQRITKTQDELLEGMELFVRQKFGRYPDLAQRLLDTDNAWIMEMNTWGDTNFGIDVKMREGRNGLGEMHMKLRSEMRDGTFHWKVY